MKKSTPRFGIRSGLEPDREVRRRYSPEGTVATHDYTMQQKLQSIGIGRFLLTRRQAKDPSIDNPLVEVSRSLESMNRRRGIAIDAGRIMLQYQSPAEFYERVAASKKRRELKNLTEKGQLEYLLDLKEKMAANFREQQDSEASTVDAQMRQESIEQSQKLFARLSQDRPYRLSTAFGSDEDIELIDWSLDDDTLFGFDEPEELSAAFVEESGAHRYTGSLKTGFLLQRATYFEDLLVGVRIRTKDAETSAQIQYDFDRINDVYDRHKLITPDYGPVVFHEHTPMFIPLFIMNSETSSHDIYLPYIPRERIDFQALGIHKIQ